MSRRWAYGSIGLVLALLGVTAAVALARDDEQPAAAPPPATTAQTTTTERRPQPEPDRVLVLVRRRGGLPASWERRLRRSARGRRARRGVADAVAAAPVGDRLRARRRRAPARLRVPAGHVRRRPACVRARDRRRGVPGPARGTRAAVGGVGAAAPAEGRGPDHLHRRPPRGGRRRRAGRRRARRRARREHGRRPARRSAARPPSSSRRATRRPWRTPSRTTR